jgi:DNA-binding transcriptional regulator YiaG
MKPGDALLESSEAPRCSACGSNAVSTTFVDEQMEYGSGPTPVHIPVRLPVHRCAACELEFTDSTAEGLRHEAICRHLGLLSPGEILAIRARLNMSRQRFAALTRLGVATLARWESGEIIQNAALDAYLRLIAKPEICELLLSGALTDSVAHRNPSGRDDESINRFPTLASNGDLPSRTKRAGIFNLCGVSMGIVPCT